MITREEILKDRDKEYPLNSGLEANLSQLLIRINKIRKLWGKPMLVTSGYRPGHYNKDAGGAVNSRHMSCQAVDIADPKGEIGMWLFNDVQVLKDCGLWMEHPQDTSKNSGTWVHLQTVPPASGVRVFRARSPQPLS